MSDFNLIVDVFKRPQIVARKIAASDLDSESYLFAALLGVLLFIANDLYIAEPWPLRLMRGIVVGMVASVWISYCCWIIGRGLGGVATYRDLRIVVTFLFIVPMGIGFIEVIAERAREMGLLSGDLEIIIGLLGLFLGIAGLHIISAGIAEVQKITRRRATLSYILGGIFAFISYFGVVYLVHNVPDWL